MTRKTSKPKLCDKDDQATCELRRQLRPTDSSTSEAAWTALIAHFYGSVFSYALVATFNEDAALDLAQETFKQMIVYYKPEYEFGPYLYTVVHNLCVDHNRKQRTTLTMPLKELVRLADEIEDMVEHLDDERPELVWQLMYQLDPPLSEILVQRFSGEGMTMDQLAAYFEVSRTTIHKRVHKALRRLKELLEKFEREGALNHVERP